MNSWEHQLSLSQTFRRNFTCRPVYRIGLGVIEIQGKFGRDYAMSPLRKFARKFSNIDFFLKILPLKDDELVMSEM